MMHSRTAEQSIWPSVVKEKTSPIDRKMTPAENKNHEQKSVAFINPVDPRTGYQCKWEDIKNLYAEGVSHSEKAEVTLKKIGSELHVQAISDIGVTLESVLIKPSDKVASKITGEVMKWEQFKKQISKY